MAMKKSEMKRVLEEMRDDIEKMLEEDFKTPRIEELDEAEEERELASS